MALYNLVFTAICACNSCSNPFQIEFLTLRDADCGKDAVRLQPFICVILKRLMSMHMLLQTSWGNKNNDLGDQYSLKAMKHVVLLIKSKFIDIAIIMRRGYKEAVL